MKKLGSIVLVALLSLTACQFSPDYTGGRFNCQSSEDCPSGYACISGLCNTNIPTTTCKSAKDCKQNQICNNGKCKASFQGCKTDKDCGDNYCINQKCYEGKQGDLCLQKEQCQIGFACEKLFSKSFCMKRCSLHTDCESTESCRPDFPKKTSLCVPICNLLKQNSCEKQQACILYKGRGYCKEQSGKKRLNQLCQQEIDCEVNLYCRRVQGFPYIRRCAAICDKNKGCSKQGQQCIPLSPENDPYGFCEPLPTQVKKGEICAGDLICEIGLQCKRLEGETYSHCRGNIP